MFERWLGPETFRKGVVAYIDAHEWGSADAADLWNALSKASGRDVGAALGSWLDQGGVPLVRAAILPDGRLELSQTRFHNHGLELPDQVWQVPVALRHSDGHAVRDTAVLLDSTRRVVALPAGGVAWIHPNADETGYYRWSVGPAMLDTLSRNATALTVRERVGFVHNIGGLLESGDLRGDDYLRLLQRFSGDHSPQVMGALAMAAGGIRGAFITPGLAPAFARYVRALLGPALDRIGMARREGEDEATSLARPALLLTLGDLGGDTRVLAYADSLARCYLANPASVDGSVAGNALCLSATRGDAALFQEYRRRFETAATPTDRQRYLAALGRFRDPALVDSALGYVLGGPLRPQELFEIPMGIGQSIRYEGKPWTWIQGNYERFTAKIPQMYTIYMPYFAAGCDRPRLQQADAFFADPAHRVPGIERELVKLEQIVDGCADLRSREGAAVAKYLNEVVGAP
jgi:alanyl aminopeptidase